MNKDLASSPVWLVLTFSRPDSLKVAILITYQEQGYQIAMEVFDSSNYSRPNGLVIAGDMMTDGALVAFQELGIRVRQDVKIATYLNKGPSILFGRTKDITTIEVSPIDIVQTTFSILDTLLAGKQPGQRFTQLQPNRRLFS